MIPVGVKLGGGAAVRPDVDPQHGKSGGETNERDDGFQ